MFAALILCSLSSFVQQQATKTADSVATILDAAAPTPFDRVIALELTPEDKILDGHGVARRIDYDAGFTGTLHVWTTSELDLFLRVEEVDGKLVAEDDNSGGGKTPYLAVAVEPARRLAIVAAAPSPSVVGSFELHLVAAPESDATRAAAARGREALEELTELQKKGEFEAARTRVSTARADLTMPDEARSSDLVAALLWEFGRRASALGQHFEARDCWSLVYRHYTRTLPRDHKWLLGAMANLGGILFYVDLRAARQLEEQVLAARERTLPPDDPAVLRAEHNLAGTLCALGELPRARRLQEHVLAVRESSCSPDDPQLLNAKAALATTLRDMHELRAAIHLQETVVEARARTLRSDDGELLLARHNLASMRARAGDLMGARAIQEAVLREYERTLPADNRDVLIARNNLADTLRQLGDLPRARALLERTLECGQLARHRDDLDILAAQSNLADVLRQMGDLAGAAALQRSVLEALESWLPADDSRVLTARENLAITRARLDDLSGALVLMESVIDTRRRLLSLDDRGLIRSENNLADMQRRAGDLARARALFEQVLAKCERALPTDDRLLLAVRLNVAITAWQSCNAKETCDALSPFILGMQARAVAASLSAPREAGEIVAGDAEWTRTALGVCSPNDASVRRLLFELVETQRGVAAEGVRVVGGVVRDEAAESLARASRSVRAEIHDFIATAPRDDTSPDRRAAALGELVRRRDQVESDLRRALASQGVAITRVDALELTSSLSTRDAAIGFLRYTHPRLDEQAHKFDSAEDHLLAHVLLSDGTLTRIELGPVAPIVEAVERWRAAIYAPIVEHASVKESQAAPKLSAIDAGRDLRRLILDPVLAEAKDANEFFVCLDDVLHLVPLDALPLDDADQQESTKAIPDGNETRRDLLVGDRYQIHVLSSFGRLTAPRPPTETAARTNLLALGGIDYDATPDGASTKRVVEAAAPPLEVRVSNASSSPTTETRSGATTRAGIAESLAEANAITKRFQAVFDVEPKLLTGASATKAAFFDLASEAGWIHIATHGWFAPESVRSLADPKPTDGGWSPMSFEEQVIGLAPMTLCGLALAGANRGPDHLGRVAGLMTAEEVGGMDLRQCELVVLSACETNVGVTRAGQGIQSLQAAFDAAGARASITSLWKVSDSAAKALFDDFYERIWVRKQDKSTALWDAKMALRAKGYPRRDWAAWVLCGDHR